MSKPTGPKCFQRICSPYYVMKRRDSRPSEQDSSCLPPLLLMHDSNRRARDKGIRVADCVSNQSPHPEIVQRTELSHNSAKQGNLQELSLFSFMHSLSEVFIYDAIRTPRGRGKPTGKLHTQTPLSLVGSLLKELNRRYPRIDQTTAPNILGCCEQFNDQGGNLDRSKALDAAYGDAT